MRIALFTIAIFISICFKAQLTYQWANNVGGTSMEYAQAIAVDPSGNVYIAGTFSGTVDFDPSASTFNLSGFSGSADIFLAKYSSTGTFIWAKQIGGTNTEKAYDVACDATGAWLAGNFMGTCDFDPSAATSNTTSLGGGTDGDGFFAKYDVNGNFQWGVRIGSTANDRCIGITTDASQNAYITGFIGFNADFDPSASSFSLNVSGTYNTYFAKYTSAGALTFAKQITGGYSEGDDIALDGSGNILLTGSYATSNDFDPSAATANLSTSSLTQLDIYLAKYDPSGNYTFAKQIGGIGVDIGFQVRPDASGNIYLGGVFSNSCDFDPTATTSVITSAGQGDLFVAKYTSAGNLSWATGTGGTSNDYCYGLGVDASSNVYITGRFLGTNIDFDPSASSSVLTSTAFCPYVAGYNSSGGFLFANTPGNIPGEGRHLIVNAASVYITGFFSTMGDFDFSASTANLVSAGSSDVYFAKYNVCAGSPPAQPSAISGAVSMCPGTSQSYSVTNDPTATGYVWSFPGGWSGSSSTNIISATAGTTGVISVAASNSCGLSIPSTLNVTVNPLPIPSFTNSGPVCSGSSLVIGANGASTYSIYGPASFAQITQSYTFTNITPLSAGVYTVIVTSAAGCTAIAQTTVIVNPQPAQPSAISGTTLLCYGNSQSYSVPVVPTATSYVWSYPGGWSGSSTTNIINLTATGASGTISVAAVNGCGAGPVSTLSVTVGGFSNASTTQTNITCFAASNATAVVSTVGGQGPFTYSWSPSSQTTATLTNASAGVHTVVVTDAYLCSIQRTVNITQPTQLILSTLTHSNVSCFAYTNGTISAAASGGSPAYTFSWVSSNTLIPGPSPTANNLPAGTYTLTVTDGNGCSTYSVYVVTQPALLNAASISTAGACSSANGSATVTFTGGTAPYTYTWSAPLSQTTNSVTGLAAGNYTIICTDSKGCVSIQSITIPSGGNPTVLTTLNPTVICAGQAATLTASGASTYSWNPSNTGSLIVVSPSVNTTYSVIGTSSAGCTGTSSQSILVNPSPTVTASTNASVLCIGQAAIITASGANTYTWSTTANGSSITVAPTTTSVYVVTGTGANGCTNSFTITQNVSSCAGISNNAIQNEVAIYPNPFNEELTIKVKSDRKIEIINCLGQQILNYELHIGENKLNTGTLEKGIYFLRIDDSKPLKLIKE